MIVNIVVTILATWRIVHAIQTEKVGAPVRRIFAGEKEDVAELLSYRDTWIAYLTMCFKCLSFWVGAVCTLLLVFAPIFLYPFAISAAAIFVDEAYRHG